MLANLLMDNWTLKMIICVPSVILAVLCAIFIIIVIMLQPSNSNGISALGGQQETFYGKNKGKTMEHKLRKLTVIAVSIMAIAMIAFCIIVFRITD